MNRPIQLDKLNEVQTQQLYESYQSEWWSSGRSLEDVRLMLENTSLIVAFADRDSGRLVAFSRILTDFVFRATIYDVIVMPDWRGCGIGRLLMDAISLHPRLQQVSSIWLTCAPDKVEFYRKWGFEEQISDVRRMSKTQREG